MKVYHGTNVHFNNIDLNKCNPNNDFGRGFYVTSVKMHAEQRAQDITDRYGGKPIVMEFEFDEKYLNDSNFNTLIFDKPSREWVEFVMKNRNRSVVNLTNNFDIVAGPIADDKMRRQFDRYEMQEITIEQLLERITYREPTHQIMLGTSAAIAIIQPNNINVFEAEDIITNISVALINERKMDMLEALRLIYNSNTFIQLYDKNTLLYQKPWQEIYELLKKELDSSN
ncbi:MAG: DUF3990 domain-containing protein [Bacteroidales bacterium]|jgi:hypothetical protein|nr:DUF3990 domain-containing protein [Bacteroidales bacterium]